MPTNAIWEARPLLERLEDPFTMFPIEGVSDTLFSAVDETETRKAERQGWWGVSRKYWSVEDEHDHDKVGLLVGAIFVLGQAAITQTVSILNKVRKLPRAQGIIPGDKEGKLKQHASTEAKTKGQSMTSLTQKLKQHASTEAKTGESKLVVINAISNYFKHNYEWSETWTAANTNGREADTIRIVLQLGMTPDSEMTDNLLRAGDCLGLGRDNPRAVAMCVQEWREAWARVLYPAFDLPDPSRSSP